MSGPRGGARHMIGRRWASWGLLGAVLLSTATGCGHSEEEWQGKLREIDDLKTQLNASQAQNKKAKGELDEAAAKIEQLKQQLKTTGIDISNLNANLEQQARAL